MFISFFCKMPCGRGSCEEHKPIVPCAGCRDLYLVSVLTLCGMDVVEYGRGDAGVMVQGKNFLFPLFFFSPHQSDELPPGIDLSRCSKTLASRWRYPWDEIAIPTDISQPWQVLSPQQFPSGMPRKSRVHG